MFVLLLALLLFAEISLQLINPQIVRFFIDQAQAGAPVGTLIRAAGLFLALGLLGQVFTVLTSYVSSNVSWRATNRLRADLTKHCLFLDMAFHTARTPGELFERIDGDVQQLANFLSLFVVQVLGNLLLLCGILVALALEDWRIGLVFTVFALLALLLLYRVRGAASGLWQRARDVSANLYGFLEERLAGIADIRPNGAIPYTMQRFHTATRTQFREERYASVMVQGIFGLTTLFLAIGSIIPFAAGAYLYLAGAFTLGTVYLIGNYAVLLMLPLRVLILQVSDLQKAGACIARIAHLLETQPAIVDGAGASLADGAPAVEFDQVSLCYGDGPQVLHAISFALAPGQTLGIVGRTGSGKTSIARLLLRLYDPAAGVIRLNRQDIRALTLRDLRQRIGMVTQDVHLFQGTVRDNLTFFDHRCSDSQLIDILQDVGLSTWLERLPNGLDTVLASAGGGLSAGEAQLLAFTRVFLKNPRLVILDEASSRLDPATEQRIEHAISRLLAGRTAVIIAHRLSTLRRVDAIMVLDEGRIVELGPHTLLAADPHSRYYRLLQVGLGEVST